MTSLRFPLLAVACFLPSAVVAQAPPALPPLPTAVSSLGAVAADGFLYVYGGHAGKTHGYDTTTVLGTFHRLKLDGGTTWEALPGGPILQGLNLAAHEGTIYRVGGMEPKNAPGEPTDNHSTNSFARFDPKTKRWEELAPLPQGRSSHDVTVVGSRLVVVGGWCLKGKGEKPLWHDTTLSFDLADRAAGWKAVLQPFQRRALTVATLGGKVYAVGGMTIDGAERKTDILDVETGKWASGPAMPGADRTAFSPSAATIAGRLILNTSAGPLYRLTADGTAWEKVGDAATKRMVARLAPHGDAGILVGGAGGGTNVGTVEIIRIKDKGEPVEMR